MPFPRVKSIDDIPSGIYYKGKLPAKNAVLVSMVGSRRCTEYGKQAALKLSGDLAERGISIVSGLADGIDSYSHIGALRHKGITIAVMGTSIDRCYPAANISLMEEIIKNDGCIIFGIRSLPTDIRFGLCKKKSNYSGDVEGIGSC